jgi:hypothetical protein
LQLFAKSPATAGSLTIDIKKNTTTNPTGFVSLLSISPTISMASADYTRVIGTINPASQSLSVGDILKLDIISLPVGLQKFRVVLKGTF